MPNYRLLNIGEQIQAGDELYAEGKWIAVTERIGSTVREFTVPTRRKIDLPATNTVDAKCANCGGTTWRRDAEPNWFKCVDCGTLLRAVSKDPRHCAQVQIDGDVSDFVVQATIGKLVIKVMRGSSTITFSGIECPITVDAKILGNVIHALVHAALD